MSDPVVVALIVTIGPTIVSLCTLAHQVRVSRRQLAKTEEIHKLANAMKDELVRTTAVESHARGLAEGRAENR